MFMLMRKLCTSEVYYLIIIEIILGLVGRNLELKPKEKRTGNNSISIIFPEYFRDSF